MDPDKRFDRAVPVLLRPGRIHMVGSAREAAEKLLYDWPGDGEAPKHRAAKRACLRALEGLAEPRKARAAFEAAAEESGILARPSCMQVLEQPCRSAYLAGRPNIGCN